MSYQVPIETFDDDIDDGTIPKNVAELSDAVVGHKITNAEKTNQGFVITLDDGTRVRLLDTSDCCAYTDLESFLLHTDMVDHIITGVGTTEEATVWHIYADMGDVLTLSVGWSGGNVGYYGYGFTIKVVPA
jgi:hypothetical protein